MNLNSVFRHILGKLSGDDVRPYDDDPQGPYCSLTDTPYGQCSRIPSSPFKPNDSCFFNDDLGGYEKIHEINLEKVPSGSIITVLGTHHSADYVLIVEDIGSEMTGIPYNGRVVNIWRDTDKSGLVAPAGYLGIVEPDSFGNIILKDPGILRVGSCTAFPYFTYDVDGVKNPKSYQDCWGDTVESINIRYP